MTSSPDGGALLGRRRALQVLGVGLTAGGLLGLEACKENPGMQSTERSGGAAPPPQAPRPPQQVAPPPAETTPTPTPAAAEAAPQPPPAAAGPSCKDAAPIDEASASLRRALQYQEKGVEAARRCRLCVQFEAKKFGDCGACKLFTGAVNPEGVCLSFAPRPS